VDMLEGKDGPLVMEVNSSPGLEGIESCTDLDVAGTVIDFIGDQVAFPDLDIRQRLTVSRGYGVADLLIPEGFELVGKAIADSKLRDRDITVLTLNRGTSVISNPKMSRILEAGDRLLCYGKLESMKDLVPERRKRRRKHVVQKLDHNLLGQVKEERD
jgi:ribosomal protein S6--L-glutamate ligase